MANDFQPSEVTVTELGARSLTAVFWGGGGAITRIFLQLCTQVVIARILGPEQYGLFAIGAIVVSFSNFFADVGIAYGLIQKEKVSLDDLRFVFTWQVVVGSLVTIAVVLVSDRIARFFGDEHAGNIINALAAICLLNALAAPSLNLLKRELDFRRIQVAQLTAYIAGYVAVGIPLAMSGLQAWSLVAAWLVQSTVMAAILYGYVRHPLKPLFWCADARTLSTYGITVFVTNMVNWLMNNTDKLIVGRVFPSRDIGLYATSYNMLYNPTLAMLGILQPVFFSASARISDKESRIANGYRSLVGCVTLFILPTFVGLAVVSNTFALAVYGSAWHNLASTLCPLALAMPLFLLNGLTTPLLWTSGKIAQEFKAQIPLALLWLIAAWYAAKISPAVVSWAVLGFCLVRLTVTMIQVSQLANINPLSTLQAARGGLLLSVICATVLAAADATFRHFNIAPIICLIFNATMGMSTMLVCLKFIPSLVDADVAALIRKVAARAPRFMAGYLRSISTN